VSAVRTRPGTFTLLESKLRPPARRPGTIPRRALVDRLRAGRRTRVVVVEAPAGYGKTSLLAEWAESDERPLGWYALDEADDEPGAFLGYLAAALGRAGADVRALADGSAKAETSARSVVAGLGRALSSLPERALVVLDDVDLLRDAACLDTVAALLDLLPSRVQLALTTRARLDLAFARLRSEGRLLELGVDDLRMGDGEAAALLRAASLDLGEAEARALNRRCEGWPSGLYLAVLALRGRGRPAADAFRGTDRFVSDYFRLEVLDGLAERKRDFLLRTSVFDRVCGPLCDATLGTTRSTAELASLADAGLFLVPLDAERRWFRFHGLFRDMLRAELERHDPGLAPAILERASDWFEASGDLESAIECAISAGERSRVARLCEAATLAAFRKGRRSTVERWFASIDDAPLLEKHPSLAVHGARLHALGGRPEAARRWADVAFQSDPAERMPDGSPAEAWLAELRALLCADGVRAMRADAERAVARYAAGSDSVPRGKSLLGFAYLLAGDTDRADETFADVVETATRLGVSVGASVGLAGRALIAAERGRSSAADELARRARLVVDAAHLDGYAPTVLVYAASAGCAIGRGRRGSAGGFVERAEGLVSVLTYAVPWLAGLTRVELARVHLALGNRARVHELLDEIDGITARVPDLGIVGARAAGLRLELERGRGGEDGWASTLTAAELRLLPFLATYLSFRQIAERLEISRNTVKTQAIAVYRKLGVSSRSEAIERAAELGLLRGRGTSQAPDGRR
jgi:LuxR family maltose regulon positive regulatory protein